MTRCRALARLGAAADKSEYIREEVSVCLVESNTFISAGFYRFNQSIADKRLIEHGDYLKFLDETGFVSQ